MANKKSALVSCLLSKADFAIIMLFLLCQDYMLCYNTHLLEDALEYLY